MYLTDVVDSCNASTICVEEDIAVADEAMDVRDGLLELKELTRACAKLRDV